jgi:hypothetical protein
LLTGHSQIEKSNLVKGKWQFCVMDTILPPFKCDEKHTVYKFKRSGKYVEKGVSMVYYGKEIKKLKGAWSLTGTTLEIDADIIINIQGDEPLLDSTDIDKVIEAKLQYPPAIAE